MLPTAHDVGGFDWWGVLVLAVVLAVIFMPVLLVRRAALPPADGGDDDRDGGSRRPFGPTRPPLGGPPLPDADQSRKRLREHGRRPDVTPRRRRRSLHRPGRRTRTLVG